jgi:ATP-dependent helicase/nuclease subunit A
MRPSQVLKAKSYLEWIEETVFQRGQDWLLYEAEPVTGSAGQQTVAEDRTEAESDSPKPDPDARFTWQYPYWDDVDQKVRFSVSEIKEKRVDPDTEEEDSSLLSFTEAQEDSGGARRGTAMHAFLANADFEKLQTKDEVEKQIRHLTEKKVLDDEEAELLIRRDLLLFGASSLCQRMRKADHLRREQPFIMSLSLAEVDALCPGWRGPSASSSASRIMIQGIIDSFFEEEDGIVLVDYKTDRMLDAERKEQYTRQLRIYQTAIERTTRLCVKEKLLYLTRTGETIPCE